MGAPALSVGLPYGDGTLSHLPHSSQPSPQGEKERTSPTGPVWLKERVPSPLGERVRVRGADSTPKHHRRATPRPLYPRASQLTSSGLIRSGAVQPSRLYSPRQVATMSRMRSVRPVARAMLSAVRRFSSVE